MVSTHPLISKGIRTVRILTSHYNPSFYDSFETFLRYKSVCLGLLIDTWEYKKPKLLDAQTSSRLNELASLPRFFSYFELTSLLVLTNFAEDVAEDDSSDRSSDKDYTEGDFSDESSDEDSTEGDSLDEDLAEDDLSDGYVSKDVSLASDKSSDESISIVKRLYIRAFFRFRSLYEDQERMLQNETFTQAVTSAITRMPLAKTLHIHDRNRTLESDSRQNASLYPKLHSLYEYVRDDEMFIEDLVKEEFGGELVDLIPGRFKDWSSPYCQLLLKLPIAIHKAWPSIRKHWH
ncbi:hypothetical protein EYC84_003290 [Monilinia fructicola]|uniref:Uncharacterized protein n=1 Tax=Monilinia fructicola TaxID=38448 RepID=A0A5M9JX34_MONFR|nr:hypothetical protein EYC84_003290 [Monilinia fructicola]